MTFKQQFSQDDILTVLDKQTPKTMTAIAEEVGCVRNTVARILKGLEQAGLVREVVIQGSNNRAWVRVLDVFETEGKITDLGCAYVGNEYAGKRFKIVVYKE